MKRLHDARHAAATVLALLEVAPPTTMDIMGRSAPAMLLRYGHVTDTMWREIAGRQDAFYFGGTRLLADLAEVTELEQALPSALAPMRQRNSGHDPGRIAVNAGLLLTAGRVGGRGQPEGSSTQARA
jgi:hypothetical protein